MKPPVESIHPIEREPGSTAFVRYVEHFDVEQMNLANLLNSHPWRGHAPRTLKILSVSAHMLESGMTRLVIRITRVPEHRADFDLRTPDVDGQLVRRQMHHAVDFNEIDFGKQPWGQIS